MDVKLHRISNDEVLQRRLRRKRSRFDAAVTLRMYRGMIFEQRRQIRHLLGLLASGSRKARKDAEGAKEGDEIRCETCGLVSVTCARPCSSVTGTRLRVIVRCGNSARRGSDGTRRIPRTFETCRMWGVPPVSIRGGCCDD